MYLYQRIILIVLGCALLWRVFFVDLPAYQRFSELKAASLAGHSDSAVWLGADVCEYANCLNAPALESPVVVCVFPSFSATLGTSHGVRPEDAYRFCHSYLGTF